MTVDHPNPYLIITGYPPKNVSLCFAGNRATVMVVQTLLASLHTAEASILNN